METSLNLFLSLRPLKNWLISVVFSLMELLVEAPAWTKKIRCGTNYTVYSVRVQELSDKKS